MCLQASKFVIYIDKFERRLNYIRYALYQIISVYILNYVLSSHYLISQRGLLSAAFLPMHLMHSTVHCPLVSTDT